MNIAAPLAMLRRLLARLFGLGDESDIGTTLLFNERMREYIWGEKALVISVTWKARRSELLLLMPSRSVR
jgi:hypothetical protein